VQAVDLNLATRPFKNDTLLWAGLVVAVLLLGSVSWWNVTTWREHRRLLGDLRESQSNIGERFAALDRRDDEALRRVDAVDLPVLVTKAAKANDVIRWKTFSWTRLFNLLQEVQPWDVQMTSIHPVFRGDRRSARNEIEDLEQVPVSVEGTAKTLKDFLAFERELIFDPHFDRVDPANIATDENSGETIFRLRFLYDPRVGVEAEIPADQIAAAEGEATASDEGTGDVVEQARADEVDAPPAAAEAPVPEESGELAAGDLKKIRRGGRKEQRAEQTPPSATDTSQEASPSEPSPATNTPPGVEAADAAPTLASQPPGVDATQNAGPPQPPEEVGARESGSRPSAAAPPRDVGGTVAAGSDRSPSVESSPPQDRTVDDADEGEEER
jgi:hypothetical protein